MDIDKDKDSAKIRQTTQDNPDLSDESVHQLLNAQAEVDAGNVEPFEFGKI